MTNSSITVLDCGDAFENSIRDAAAQNAENLRRVNSIADEFVAENIASLIDRVTDSSLAEIDCVVSDLAAMRQHIEDESENIQSVIVEFARLSQSSFTSTKTMANALEQMKNASHLR